MKAINNPLYPMLEELLKKLNSLRGLLYFFRNTLVKYFKQIIDSKVDFSHLVFGSSLVIRKITEFPKNVCGYYYPTGKFEAKGREYLETFNQLIERESAWTISQGYERFESFLFDIVAALLANNNKFAKEEKKKSIKKCEKKLNQNKSQLNNEEWKEVLKKRYHNIDILKNIGECIPNFKNAMENNNEKINLLSWYSVISEVRHAATHSDLIIKNERLQKELQSQEKKSMLEEYFPGEKSSIGYKINLSEEKTELNLRILGELAVEIFYNLSIKANYDHDIEWLKEMDSKT